MNDAIKTAAARLVALLRERGVTLSAAESCTGGWFAKTVVDVPGASAVFAGGVVSYINAVKEEVLGVPAALLEAYTAVSSPVAAAMAEGVRQLMKTDLAISVTGLAGPGGGTAEIPVGRVYLGLATREETETVTLDLPGDRTAVRQGAVLCMLQEIIKRLS
jgi:PncC family amidohydrolase